MTAARMPNATGPEPTIGPAEEADQQYRRAVVVQIQPHSPTMRANSSGEIILCMLGLYL